MSPSTAPASTDTSWRGSPTRTRRAVGRTAARSLAIIDRPTIELSSTITTWWGSWLVASWRKRLLLSGRQPSRRCRVEAGVASSAGPDRVVDRHVGRLGVDGFGEAGGGLAGGRGQGDAGRGLAERGGLLVEQRDDAGDGGGLAGAGAAGDDGEAALDGGLGGDRLEVDVARIGAGGRREEAVEAGGEGVAVDGGRRRRWRGRGGRRRWPARGASSGRGRGGRRSRRSGRSAGPSSPTATSGLAATTAARWRGRARGATARSMSSSSSSGATVVATEARST